MLWFQYWRGGLLSFVARSSLSSPSSHSTTQGLACPFGKISSSWTASSNRSIHIMDISASFPTTTKGGLRRSRRLLLHRELQLKQSEFVEDSQDDDDDDDDDVKSPKTLKERLPVAAAFDKVAKATTKTTAREAPVVRRRSTRKHPIDPLDDDHDSETANVDRAGEEQTITTKTTKSSRKRKKSTSSFDDFQTLVEDSLDDDNVEKKGEGLPRTREMQIQNTIKEDKETSKERSILKVIGVDEAGRGPLAGPVVAASIVLPPNIPTIDGVIDSKKITKEEDREILYEKIVNMPHINWAVAVVDAKTIDEINILQATLLGMKMSMEAIMNPPIIDNTYCYEAISTSNFGNYVVCSMPREPQPPPSNSNDDNNRTTQRIANDDNSNETSTKYHALIDGNKLPKEMPCDGESIVKGDSKECCIAAASILAKVTRDRLMNQYDKLYPLYNLKKHKGYPTAAHMSLVKEHGASPIHRRTFAPLKYLKFDENGQILS